MSAPDPARAAKRYLAVMMFSVALISIAMCCLPASRFIRFDHLSSLAVVKLGWIYNRIHSDKTPIDVMFVGSSRTVFDLDSEELESACEQDGRIHPHVVNMGLQHAGRDMDYLVVREALESRHVQLLVVEVTEIEPRDLHPAFSSVADVWDVLSAPLIINPSYFNNLAYMPLRQITLFLSGMERELTGRPPGFLAGTYRGSHWDDTYAEYGSIEHPAQEILPRLKVHTSQELLAQRRPGQDTLAGVPLPQALRYLEHRANLVYIAAIAKLASEHGVTLRFLYLPQYSGKAGPDFISTYTQYAPVWAPGPVIQKQGLWLDINHLNHAGAEAITPILATKIEETLLNH